MRPVALILLPAVLLLSGCAFAPRGPVVAEERDIDLATTVELDTSGNLSIREGEPSLVVRAPQVVLDRLTSTVKDGVLTLGTTPGTPDFLLGWVRYELTLPTLEGLEINGSGDIRSDVGGESLSIEINGSGDLELRDIDASAVTLDISGSGDVDLRGRTDELTVSIDGSADLDADYLDAARVSIDLDGSGELDVAASDTLDVSISGSGSVSYKGRPEVTQDISGSGDVSPR